MTKTYHCTVTFDASKGTTVEADSAEEAAEKAMDAHGYVSLCHQCSDEVEVGDAHGVVVYEDDKEALDTTWHAEECERFNTRIRTLEDDLREAATTLRRYEALHRAKGTADSTDKAEKNAELATRFEATLAG